MAEKQQATQEEKQARILAWENHENDALERQLYSIKRIDIMIVSLSGACIYIAFQILRFLHSPDGINVDSCTWWLKVSAISSVVAIAVNFLSQISGYQANKNEAIYANGIIKDIQDDKEDDSELLKFDNLSKAYAKWTDISNIISTFFMIGGIILLVIYNLITF